MSKKKMSVLLVDDEREILNALYRRFRKEDFNFFIAESAEVALQILESEKIHVIISDSRMVGVSGLQLLEKVKDLYPEVVRIMISGFIEPNHLVDAINRGEVFRFIKKPWDEENLKDVILEGLTRYLLNRDVLKRKGFYGDRYVKTMNHLMELIAEIDRPTICIDDTMIVHAANPPMCELMGFNTFEPGKFKADAFVPESFYAMVKEVFENSEAEPGYIPKGEGEVDRFKYSYYNLPGSSLFLFIFTPSKG